MALTPNFTCSQIIGASSEIVFEDTSTGADAAVVARRIYLQTNLSTYLVPSGTTTSYIAWALVTNPITEDVLDKDYALTVKIDWLDVSNAILYTKTLVYVFQRFNIEFDYSLTYSEANGGASLNSSNWLKSRMQLRLSIEDADSAITEASSVTDSQAACDRGTYLRLNTNLFY